MSSHILIIDEDVNLRENLRKYFEGAGYTVSEASTIAQARAELEKTRFHLVTVDINFLNPGDLVRDEGKEIAREIRSKYDCGIIAISVIADQKQRNSWLEDWADDTIVKPVNPQELLARTRAVLRRYHPRPARETAQSDRAGDIARFANWTLNLKRVELQSRPGKRVELTNGDFNLLSYFLMHPREVLLRPSIANMDPSIRSRTTSESVARAVDMRVSRLRGKLSDDDTGDKRLIRTVRNVGYMLAAEVEWSDAPA